MQHDPCLPQALPNNDDMQRLLKQRVRRFEGYKRGILTYWIQEYEGDGSTKEEKKGIKYPVVQFMNLINILLDPTKAISGVRIYFATYLDNSYVPKGYVNLMTVIFAPTRTENGNNNCDKKEKNIGEYYILKPDLPASTSDDIKQLTTEQELAMKDDWIQFYQKKKIDVLERATGRTFKETQSIWFNQESILSWRDGILSATPAVKQVILGFASYKEGDSKIPDAHGGAPSRIVDNQVSIVLSISSDFLKDTDTYFVPRSAFSYSLVNNESGEKSNSNNFLNYFTSYYDTGKPCPPPTAGCS